jgi:AraC family transcriptional regulator
MKNIQGQNSKREYVSRINRVIDYIKNNITEDLSLEQLSNIAAFSKYYFHRIFKSISGENLNSYVNRIRIEKSAYFLIHHPETPITSIAYDSGFSSPAVYSRAFKAHYKITPSQWREAKDINKSKICKADGNTCQSNDNNCEGTGKVTMYIDSRTKKPIWRIEMKDNKSLDINVNTMPDIDIAYLRHHGQYNPHDKQLFQGLFAKLLGWAIPRELFNPPTTKAMTVYSGGHPDTTAPENLSVDVCISIDKGTVVDGEVGKRVIPGGKYAVVSLTDATMEECGKAWNEVFNNWLPESGYQPADGGYYCNHLNDPEQHPQKLHNVEMYLPIKPL